MALRGGGRNRALGLGSVLALVGAGAFIAWHISSHRPESERVVKPVKIPWRWRGSRKARICISAAIPPDECVLPVIKYLEGLVRKYPRHVYVEFADFAPDLSVGTYRYIDPGRVPKSRQPGFKGLPFKRGPFCAYILVNHRVKFLIEGKKVMLVGPPGVLYTVGDLEKIVEREMELQYGGLPGCPPRGRKGGGN